MTASSQKGTRREREIVKWFRANGWGAIRIPTSGASTDAPLPDVLAGSGSMDLAIEAKTGQANVLYADASEVDELRTFADAFGAIPVVGCRWDQDRRWYLYNMIDGVTLGPQYRRTDAGTFAFDHPDDEWDGWTLTPDAADAKTIGRAEVERIIDELEGES